MLKLKEKQVLIASEISRKDIGRNYIIGLPMNIVSVPSLTFDNARRKMLITVFDFVSNPLNIFEYFCCIFVPSFQT